MMCAEARGVLGAKAPNKLTLDGIFTKCYHNVVLACTVRDTVQLHWTPLSDSRMQVIALRYPIARAARQTAAYKMLQAFFVPSVHSRVTSSV